MTDLAAFLVFVVAWGLAGQVMLALRIHPAGVAAVWLIGFVWGAGYIAAGRASADTLTLTWLGSLAGICVAGTIIALAF